MNQQTLFDETIAAVSIEEEMQQSYLDYAMSVIVARALPDVRDGLKPVHRRILYAMFEGGYDYNKAHKKSARIVGEVMAKYHPHGDMPIYDAMARMVQDFAMGIPLIDGQGNFGSVDGDPPAASRYTEARLAKITHTLVEDIDKETVTFHPNYDGSCEEPDMLPASFPNLLANGASGIAVGMATNIPPYNLGELIEGCCALIQDTSLTPEALLHYIPGPDFPTGGTILNNQGVRDAFYKGRGSIVMRAKLEIEEKKGDRTNIVATAIPYQVNKAKMVEKIAELIRDKEIEGIGDIRDESSRQGMRVVLELKKDANAEVIMNQLYKHTQLQTNFSANILALVKGRPQLLSVHSCLRHFLDFRREVIVNRTKYYLKKAREKAHTLLGFAIALANLDEVIRVIRSAADRSDALQSLLTRQWKNAAIVPFLRVLHEEITEDHTLTEIQANAILDLRLHRLTALESEEIQNNLKKTIDSIEEYLSILASAEKISEILIQELLSVKELYAKPRKTEIVHDEGETDILDLIPSEDMIVTVTYTGYIKRVPLSTYRAQHRGGKGRSGILTKEEDVVRNIFMANTHQQMMFFSSIGKVYQLAVHKLPLGNLQAKGRAMVNLLPLAKDEKITVVLVLPQEMESDKTFFFVTSQGHVRRNQLSAFERIASNGKRAMVLEENEELVSVLVCTDQDDILMNTHLGNYVRFSAGDIRIFSGRDSTGVRGIKLAKNDRVISASVLDSFNLDPLERDGYFKQSKRAEDVFESIVAGAPDIPADRFREMADKEQFILTITERGYGKRASAYEYRTTHRGGSGGHALLLSKKNGNVVGAFSVTDADQIILITDKGKILRCAVNDIRITGRRTQGVIVLRTDEEEKVVSVTKVGDEVGDVMDVI